MAKFTSTLLGMTLVTACTASQADAGLFDWFMPRPVNHTTQVARPYSANYYGTNNSIQCGPNGCKPCTNGQCGTTVRPANSYGYSTPSPTYYPSSSNYSPANSTCFPTTSNYGNSSVTPCQTGNCPTTQLYTTPYHPTPYNSGVNGNPYYGQY